MQGPILLFLLILPAVFATIVYEYGEDSPDAEEIAHLKGKIGFLKPVSVVQIPAPICFNITYVLVKVENDISLPTITYCKHFVSVFIFYFGILTDSRSTYSILAKGIPLFCVPSNKHQSVGEVSSVVIMRRGAATPAYTVDFSSENTVAVYPYIPYGY